MSEKPDVLSDEPSIDELEECVAIGSNYVCREFESAREAYKRGQRVERDAAVAYYEPLIQQAKAEVAREIFNGFRTKFLGYLFRPAGHGRNNFKCPKWCQHCEFESFESKYLQEEK